MKGRDYTIVVIIVLAGVFLSLIAGCFGGSIAGFVMARRGVQPGHMMEPEFMPPRFDEDQPLVPPEPPVMPDVPRALQPPVGALIQYVEPDSPADEARLQSGDVIIELDGEEITARSPLHEVVRWYDPGDRVEIVYWRAGKEKSVEVKLGEHPEEEDVPFLGVRFVMIDEEMHRGD